MTVKTLHRIGYISNNASRQVLTSLFGMAIPFMVIHYSSKETWGSFVSFLLFSLFVLQIINWGNKEYLLREFSLAPNKMNENYSRILFTRLPLVLLCAAIGFFYFSVSFGFFIFLWLFGKYLSHSVEALIVYEKKFNASMVIELATFTLFCCAFYLFKSKLNLYFLLVLYSLYQFAKGVYFFLLFRNFFSFKNQVLTLDYYKTAFPFFLLSVLGFLASKVDVYLIEHLGNRTITSDYQIINSLLVFIMSLSAFIYVPFTKNIYRNTDEVIQKTLKLLSYLGLFIVPTALVIVFFIIKYLLNLHFSILFYIVSFFYVYPSFLYGIEIVNLFRLHKERTVVKYLSVGAIANAVLSGLFLYFGFGITGALTGSAIAQLIALLLFKSESRFEKQNYTI